MSSTKQDQEFAKIIKENIEAEISVGSYTLDSAIEYIGSNFNPEDVFSEMDLDDWAAKNNYTKE